MTIPLAAKSSSSCTPSLQSGRRRAVRVYFLEIVTPDNDAACELYSMMYGVTFGDFHPDLGGARTAWLEGGGMLWFRAPLRATEATVVHPYVLVYDIGAAASAAEAGAEIAIPPTEIASYRQFAISITWRNRVWALAGAMPEPASREQAHFQFRASRKVA